MDHAELEDLASAVYAVVLPVVGTRRGQGRIYYGQVTERLAGRWAGLNPHDPRLAEALGHICSRCRAAGLPVLSALVVGRSTGKPGGGYYHAAHPEVEEKLAKEVAWANEVPAVHKATYPSTFEELGR